MDNVKDSRSVLESQVSELQRESDELHSDNRRMAEMLATSEGESREVADMIERLSEEKVALQRQCVEHREKGLFIVVLITLTNLQLLSVDGQHRIIAASAVGGG